MMLLCHNGFSGGLKLSPFVYHQLVIASHYRVYESTQFLPLFLSTLNYKYFTQKCVISSPSGDLFPFADYCIDHVEHRTKLNRKTGDMQHSCNRCFLFQLYLYIVFSVLLPWMASERHQWCTSSIFQQAGRHTGST